ncbi:MAG: FlgD immunoglobulin-like domain containing protein [bacterium]
MYGEFQRRSSIVLLFTTSLGLFLATAGIAAGPGYFREDFSNRQYADLALTTAWWDTMSGQVRLHPHEIELLAIVDTPGSAVDVAVFGNLAFVGDGEDGLQVLDITDPESVGVIGTLDTPGYAWGVAVDGDWAYVGDGGVGVQVCDISDPTLPVITGVYNTPGMARGVAVAGDLVLVADGVTGLALVDVSDPTAPQLVGIHDTPGSAIAVAVAGDLAYVADRESGLQIVDISDPTSPTSVGSYDTPDDTWAVAVDGDLVYLGDSGNGIVIVDASDPTLPVLLGALDTSGSVRGIQVAGDELLVAAYYQVLVLDVSNPTSPFIRHAIDTPGTVTRVASAGIHAFAVAGSGGGFISLRYRERTDPLLLGSISLPGPPLDLVVAGDYAFVADYTNGLAVVDISDPFNPIFIDTLVSLHQARTVCLAGDVAFIAMDNRHLGVADISDPENPVHLSTWVAPGLVRHALAVGDLLYVACDAAGLLLLDITDPLIPVQVGQHPVAPLHAAWRVTVAGDFAYLGVAGSVGGVEVVDVSDPTNPVHADDFLAGTNKQFVVVSGDECFAMSVNLGFSFFASFDISDPSFTTSLDSYDVLGAGGPVVLGGDDAFVLDGNEGLMIFDIENAANLTLEQSVATGGGDGGLAIAGDVAYVAETSGFTSYLLYQDDYDLRRNVAQSIAVPAVIAPVVLARITPVQTDGVLWEITGDGGVTWAAADPGIYTRLVSPGSDLRWRLTNRLTQPFLEPVCRELELDWYYTGATIDSVADVPDDQGGWARLHFTRSGYDFSQETEYPVTGYNVFRRVDDITPGELADSSPDPRWTQQSSLGRYAARPGIELARVGDRELIVGSGKRGEDLPPGLWEVVGYVAAHQQDDYLCLVPTLADSVTPPIWSVYCVSAETTTPSVFFISPPDSGFSSDDIAPQVPSELLVAYAAGSGNTLTWQPCPDDDFAYFKIYRGDSPDFEPEPADLLHATVASDWLHAAGSFNDFYRVAAVDGAGNESETASPTAMTDVVETTTPLRYRLHGNSPNPFNPTTVIRYDLPVASRVTVLVFDVSGRLVRTLLAGDLVPAGRQELVWSGRDDRGRTVATGVYFCRLITPDFRATGRMLHVK